MDDTNKKKAGWKQKILHEMVEYYINFVYLALFLIAHIWYRRLILAEYHIVYTNYWWPLIEAAVLAKVIMVGDILRLGRGLEHRSLIMPTLYRTVFVLREVQLLSTAEVADLLELTPEAVKQRLSRAKSTLRSALEQRTGEALSTLYPFEAPRCDRVVAGALAQLDIGS